jgi:hypothetical protein
MPCLGNLLEGFFPILHALVQHYSLFHAGTFFAQAQSFRLFE